MDEFTSALDIKTEEIILQKLIKYKNNKTIIIITHRTSTLKYCDVKYLLKDGSISKIN